MTAWLSLTRKSCTSQTVGAVRQRRLVSATSFVLVLTWGLITAGPFTVRCPPPPHGVKHDGSGPAPCPCNALICTPTILPTLANVQAARFWSSFLFVPTPLDGDIPMGKIDRVFRRGQSARSVALGFAYTCAVAAAPCPSRSAVHEYSRELPHQSLLPADVSELVATASTQQMRGSKTLRPFARHQDCLAAKTATLARAWAEQDVHRLPSRAFA